MVIDICLLAILGFAVFKGLTRGLVMAVCSFLAIIIGLAAAVKTSSLVARWLSGTIDVQASWLPFLAFALVMIAVMLLARMAGRLVETTLHLTMLGWANRLGGILLFGCIYVTLFSVLLFYLEQLHMLKPETIAASASYSYIYFWGPEALQLFGNLLPVFKGMFGELSQFFGSLTGNPA
ncbi:MAG: CvpA family protein [Sediminibacterium sp.]|nr:CvpA family protein [Sediminibacterium sp.]